MTWHTTSALADHLGVSPNAIRSAYSKGHKVKGHHVERRLEGRKAFFRLVDTHPAAKWFEDKAPGGTVKGYDTQEELHEAMAAETGEIIHQRGDYTIVEESGHFDSVPHDLYMQAIHDRNKYRLAAEQAEARLANSDANRAIECDLEVTQARLKRVTQERDKFQLLSDQIGFERNWLLAQLQRCKDENGQLHAVIHSHYDSIKELERTNERLFSELQSSRSSGLKGVVRELRNRAKGIK